MYFLGWASIAGQEVWNVERTTTYLRANAPGLELSGCDECSTLSVALMDSAYKNNPVDDPAPWIAADDPDLNDFYGFYPMSMEGLYDSTVEVTVTESIGHGGTTSTPRMATREMRVTGVLLAGTRIALNKSRGWLRGTLSGSGCTDAGECGGDDFCFFADCPDTVDQGDYYLRTMKDVVLTAGPTLVQPYGQLPSGVFMDSIEFTLTAAVPWIYGPMTYLGTSLGTDDTTPGGMTFPVERGETHGYLPGVDHYLPFPAGTEVGDLLVTAYGSTQINNTNLPPGWTIPFDQSTQAYFGKMAWKIAEAEDVDLGALYVRMNTNGNGHYTMIGIQAGTFDPDNPIRTDAILRPAGGASLPQILTPFTSTAKSLTYFFCSRDSLDQDVSITPGLKRWSDTISVGGAINNAAMYYQENPNATLISPVFDATPHFSGSNGGFYAALEIMPVAIPPILTLDPTPPQLPECNTVPPAPISDPSQPTVPAPPRPPSVITSLQPPSPYRSGYALYIPPDQVPEAIDAVLIITLTTGSQAARWIRLRLYTAPMGVDQKVEDLDPCSFCGDITVMYIPPNSKFVIDGMNQRVYIEDTIGNQYPAGHLAYSTGGTPTQWASVTCAMGYWLTVEFAGDSDPANLFITGTSQDSSTFNVNLGQWSNGINDGSPRALKYRDTSQYHLAPASMRVDWPLGSTDEPQVVLNNLIPGHAYKLSMWIKSPTVAVVLGLGDAGWVQSVPNANWVQFDTNIIATDPQMIAWLRRITNVATTNVWVDEFGLHDVTLVTSAIVQVSISTARRE